MRHRCPASPPYFHTERRPLGNLKKCRQKPKIAILMTKIGKINLKKNSARVRWSVEIRQRQCPARPPDFHSRAPHFGKLKKIPPKSKIAKLMTKIRKSKNRSPHFWILTNVDTKPSTERREFTSKGYRQKAYTNLHLTSNSTKLDKP